MLRFLGFCVLGSLAWLGCGSPASDKRSVRPPPLVLVDQPRVRDVPVEVRSPVDLRPKEQADLISKQVGYLSRVLVDRGDAVKRGQLVALVQPSELPNQLQIARGQLAQADAAVEQARQNRQRAGNLSAIGVLSMQELQQNQTALVQATAQQASAKAALQAASVRLIETRLESPMDGVVLQRRLDPGSLVGPQQGAIVSVGRVDVLRAFVPVREQESAAVQLGQPVQLTVDALPEEEFSGQVVRVSPTFDPLTRTLEAEVHLGNASGRLRPGMYGRARIVVGVHKDALTVPESAVQRTHLAHFLFVVALGKVERRAVTVGVDGGTFLEITRGLQKDETLVVAGADGLADGMTVRTQTGNVPWKKN